MASILTPTCLDTCPIRINFLAPSIRHPHRTPLSVVQSQAQSNVRTEAGRRWDRLPPYSSTWGISCESYLRSTTPSEKSASGERSESEWDPSQLTRIDK